MQRRLSGGWQGGFNVSGAQHEDHCGNGGGEDDLEELDAGAEFCTFHIELSRLPPKMVTGKNCTIGLKLRLVSSLEVTGSLHR